MQFYCFALILEKVWWFYILYYSSEFFNNQYNLNNKNIVLIIFIFIRQNPTVFTHKYESDFYYKVYLPLKQFIIVIEHCVLAKQVCTL